MIAKKIKNFKELKKDKKLKIYENPKENFFLALKFRAIPESVQFLQFFLA